jgi:hypothetical protein
MLRYFIEYPRNFCNEYEVYAVPSVDVPRFRAAFPEAEPITRTQAIKKGWTRVREAKRDNEQWFGGFHENLTTYSDTPETVPQAITACAMATLKSMEEAEYRKEAAAELMRND